MRDRTIERRRILVRGIVQGVGFRPFVHRLAGELALAGWVVNRSDSVRIEVEGPSESVREFERRLKLDAPPLAVILGLESVPAEPRGEAGFRILESQREAGASTPIPPDIATCADCLREMRDPSDRRFRYPFLNCTNCGPRFTIIRGVPYDRPLTTMDSFAMCAACEREYHDPANRRFHAQPTACPACGPQVWFATARNPAEVAATETVAIARARDALRAGEVIAVKGIGGFHLACDATRAEAVERLRERKHRQGKPLAVMVPDVAAARRYAEVSREEEAVLASPRRPIVLLRKNDGAIQLAAQVAPGHAHLGLLLPYSPLHHLLIGESALVMTSGNLSEEPIAKTNQEAIERLGAIADGFLMHDRDIHAVCDDSVVRVFHGAELPLRRSRGYTPFPVTLAHQPAPLVAVGGELKTTFCLTKGRSAYLSQHIGDMGNLETLEAFERALEQFCRLFEVEPALVACDLHPGYLSTQWAHRFAAARGLPVIGVQHHHAHIASLMAESGLEPGARVIGVAWDGTGYGTDAAIWGSEFLVASYAAFERVAHLKPIPLPGGDAAIRRPYRSALAHLAAAGLEWNTSLACVAACPPAELHVLRRQLETGLHSVPSTSMGRLFDAFASITGVGQEATYEAQAAMELEARAGGNTAAEPYHWPLPARLPMAIDPAPLLRAVIGDLERARPLDEIAARIHASLSEVLIHVCRRIRDASGLNRVALSGGTFQNVLLLEQATRGLAATGFEVLVHRLVPPNDGGLALGQAAVAAAACVAVG